MSFSLSDLKTELDNAVNGAVSFVDLADKTAQAVEKFTNIIPGVGSEVQAAVDALNTLDSALQDVKSALGA